MTRFRQLPSTHVLLTTPRFPHPRSGGQPDERDPAEWVAVRFSPWLVAGQRPTQATTMKLKAMTAFPGNTEHSITPQDAIRQCVDPRTERSGIDTAARGQQPRTVIVGMTRLDDPIVPSLGLDRKSGRPFAMDGVYGRVSDARAQYHGRRHETVLTLDQSCPSAPLQDPPTDERTQRWLEQIYLIEDEQLGLLQLCLEAAIGLGALLAKLSNLWGAEYRDQSTRPEAGKERVSRHAQQRRRGRRLDDHMLRQSSVMRLVQCEQRRPDITVDREAY